MDVSALIAERAQLLARVEQIDAALKLAQARTRAVEIRTHKNIRNTAGVSVDPANRWGDVVVYADQKLTKPTQEHLRDGWISAADAARLKSEGRLDGYAIEIFE